MPLDSRYYSASGTNHSATISLPSALFTKRFYNFPLPIIFSNSSTRSSFMSECMQCSASRPFLMGIMHTMFCKLLTTYVLSQVPYSYVLAVASLDISVLFNGYSGRFVDAICWTPRCSSSSWITKTFQSSITRAKSRNFLMTRCYFQAQQSTSVIFSMSLIARTVAEPIPNPDLLIEVDIADVGEGDTHDPVHGAWARKPGYLTQSAKAASGFHSLNELGELQAFSTPK